MRYKSPALILIDPLSKRIALDTEVQVTNTIHCAAVLWPGTLRAIEVHPHAVARMLERQRSKKLLTPEHAIFEFKKLLQLFSPVANLSSERGGYGVPTIKMQGKDWVFIVHDRDPQFILRTCWRSP